MQEKIIGICVRSKLAEVHFCLSVNVFAVGIEFYDKSFVFRFGPAFVSLSWGCILVSKKDTRLERAGVTGYNKPKATPSHPTKSHVVVAKSGDTVKTIRFGQQGVKGSPDGSKRNEAFKSRHAKNIAKGNMSAAYWADKVKW